MYLRCFVSLHRFNGISDYRRSLTGSVPGFGQILLRTCLAEVHKDIIKCWNFKGEVNYLLFMLRSLDLCPHCQVLNSNEFSQLMLHLVQDVHVTPDVSMYVLIHFT